MTTSLEFEWRFWSGPAAFEVETDASCTHGLFLITLYFLQSTSVTSFSCQKFAPLSKYAGRLRKLPVFDLPRFIVDVGSIVAVHVIQIRAIGSEKRCLGNDCPQVRSSLNRSNRLNDWDHAHFTRRCGGCRELKPINPVGCQRPATSAHPTNDSKCTPVRTPRELYLSTQKTIFDNGLLEIS
jgi:hypothetical protein